MTTADASSRPGAPPPAGGDGGAVAILRTVGWIGDGDDDAFFSAVERIFDLRLRSHLPWTTFGEVRDHVVAHVAARGGAGTACATQMVFYRLRRALACRRHVGPDTRLRPLHGRALRQWFRDLEAATDLSMPETRVGPLGIAGGLCLAIAAGILALTSWPPPLRLLAAGGTSYLGLWLRHLGPRRLPRGCGTIGELARMTTERNRGRLAREGARLAPEEIWEIIRRLAVDESGADPATIGAGTTFFRDRTKATSPPGPACTSKER